MERVDTLPNTGLVIWAVAAEPQNPSHLFAGGTLLQGTGQVGGKLYESGDDGATWSDVDYGSTLRAGVLALLFDYTEAGRILVGTDGDGGIREGVPPSQRTQRFRAIGSKDINRVSSLVWRPGQTGVGPAGTLYFPSGTPAATLTARSDGTYSLPPLTPGIYAVDVKAPPGLQLFAGTLPGGVPAVGAGGGSAAPSSSGSSTGPTSTPAPSGSAGSSSDSTAFAALVPGGIFISYDRGLHWANASNRIDATVVGQVAFSADGLIVYIGTGGPGVALTPSPGGVFRGTGR